MSLRSKIEAEIARIDSIRTDNEAAQLIHRGSLIGLRWVLERLEE